MIDNNGDLPFAMAPNPIETQLKFIINYIQDIEYAKIITGDEEMYYLFVLVAHHVVSPLLEKGFLNKH